MVLVEVHLQIIILSIWETVLEKSYENNVDVRQLYVDYNQTYDSTNRDQLIEIMKEFGIPIKLD